MADVLIETQAGHGAIKLYTPEDDANALQVRIVSTNPSANYEVPVDATRCPENAPAGSSCYELDDEVVSAAAVTSARVGFYVSAKLPPTAPSGYRGASAGHRDGTRRPYASRGISRVRNPAARPARRADAEPV